MTNSSDLDYTDVRSRTAPNGMFRVIAINSDQRSAKIVGTYKTFLDAKAACDEGGEENTNYYVHGDGPRVLYKK